MPRKPDTRMPALEAGRVIQTAFGYSANAASHHVAQVMFDAARRGYKPFLGDTMVSCTSRLLIVHESPLLPEERKGARGYGRAFLRALAAAILADIEADKQREFTALRLGN